MPNPEIVSEEPSTILTRSFVLVVSATFAYFVAIGALLPALPLYVQDELGGETLSVGVVVGAFSVAALALRPWAGHLGDRHGRRLLVIAGAAVVGASIALYPTARSVAALICLRMMTGVGEALFFIGVVTAATDLAPQARRAEAMSLFSLAPYAGVAVGPVVAERLLDGGGFIPVWIAAASSALVATALGLLLPETGGGLASGPARRQLLHPAGLLPGAVLLTIFVGFAGFNAFIALYAREVGMDDAQLPFVIFATVLLMIRSAGARIPDRLGVARAARYATTGAAVGLGTIGIWPTTTGLLLGTVVFAAGQALAFPALMALAVRRAPASERSSVVGTFTAFVDLAFGLGPVCLGALASRLGLPAAFLASGAVAVAGLVLLGNRRQQLTPPLAAAAPCP